MVESIRLGYMYSYIPFSRVPFRGTCWCCSVLHLFDETRRGSNRRAFNRFPMRRSLVIIGLSSRPRKIASYVVVRSCEHFGLFSGDIRQFAIETRNILVLEIANRGTTHLLLTSLVRISANHCVMRLIQKFIIKNYHSFVLISDPASFLR